MMEITGSDIHSNTSIPQEKTNTSLLQAIRDLPHATRMLVLAGSMSLATALSSCSSGCNQEKSNEQQAEVKKMPPKLVPTEKLHGKHFSDVYSYFLAGQDSLTMKDTLLFDANKNIKNSFEKKFKRSNPRELMVAQEFYNTNISKIDFNAATPLSLDEYKNGVQKEIDTVNQYLDWKKMTNVFFHGDEKKSMLFAGVCRQIDKECLFSYTLTEFFPSDHGTGLNKDVFEFLLKNGGEEYISFLPAMNDQYASRGPYQFTSKALYDVGNQEEGSSVINEYMPKEHKIPGSVIYLSPKDHHRAAYLFAIYNLFLLFRTQEVSSLQHLMNNKCNLLQLIAIAHNKPGNIDDAFNFWKKAGFKGNIYEQLPDQKQFTASRLYAERTFCNYTGKKAEYADNSNYKKSQAKYQSKAHQKHTSTKNIHKKETKKPQNKNLQKKKGKGGKH